MVFDAKHKLCNRSAEVVHDKIVHMTTVKRNIDKFWAGGFLYSPKSNSVLLHLRDGNTKFNPNMWAFFGGLNEGKESPLDTFVRELEEEIGLRVRSQYVTPLCDYLNVELNTYRFVYYVVKDIDLSELTLGEGAGFEWVPISNIESYDLTQKSKEDIDVFLDQQAKQ